MAARQQPRGTGLEVQYKDFVPKSDWKDQLEAILFTIDLPGFTKEQIKVMYVHASTMIRVTGERSLAGRKWSRFNKVFTVPQNCLANKIHGSFNNNTLTITMPKETIKKMPNLPETSKTMADKVEKLEEKRLLEESTRKEKEAEAEKKKKLLEEKEGILRKLQEEAKAKEMAEAKKLQEEAIAKEKAEARRVQEEAKAKEMVEARRLQEEVIAKEKAEARRLQEEAKAKEMAEARRLQEAAIEKEKLLEEAALEKKIQDNKYMDEFVRKEKMKEKLSYSVLEENKTGKGIMEKIRGREITSEEKKLMMNVGVSAFVIFALGAYVSYRPE